MHHVLAMVMTVIWLGMILFCGVILLVVPCNASCHFCHILAFDRTFHPIHGSLSSPYYVYCTLAVGMAVVLLEMIILVGVLLLWGYQIMDHTTSDISWLLIGHFTPAMVQYSSEYALFHIFPFDAPFFVAMCWGTMHCII